MLLFLFFLVLFDNLVDEEELVAVALSANSILILNYFLLLLVKQGKILPALSRSKGY